MQTKPTHTIPSFRFLSILGVGMIIAAALAMCFLIGSAGGAFAATPAAAKAPVSLSIAIFREDHATAADGTTSIKLVPAVKAVPGDRLVYVLTYANIGSQPVNNLIVDYPMPQGVSYRAPADGSVPPLVSSDGVHFELPGASGGSRPGLPGDNVTALRWQVGGEVAPGAQGEVSFKANFN